MERPTVEEIHVHAKVIYYSILTVCILIVIMFTYVGYITYKITKGSNYSFISYIVFLPTMVALGLTVLLTYTGKRKFYRIVKKEELEEWSREQ